MTHKIRNLLQAPLSLSAIIRGTETVSPEVRAIAKQAEKDIDAIVAELALIDRATHRGELGEAARQGHTLQCAEDMIRRDYACSCGVLVRL